MRTSKSHLVFLLGFPTLLVNGLPVLPLVGENIPPHNLGEVIDGVVMMIDNPDVSVEAPDDGHQGTRFSQRAALSRNGRDS